MMTSSLGMVTYQDIDRRKLFETFAEQRGHYVYVDTEHNGDVALCACGWSGTPYWDGVGKAWIEWRRHVVMSSVTM
ncbi:hypothetical protein K2P47_00675 [Patescibacteria group bacterium]|nr:hypothetical protein [Patescibacteria group bacterium]